MQLKKRQRRARFAKRLRGHVGQPACRDHCRAMRQGAAAQELWPDTAENDNFGPGIAYSELDSALLVYQEAGGRVQAIEPAARSDGAWRRRSAS